jgi:triacylglycerol lipase
MVYRLTRFLLILQLTAAVALFGLAWQWWHAGWPAALLFGFGAVALVRLAINANNFRIARRYRSPTPADMVLSVPQAIGMFAAEFAASMMSSSWTMPFHFFGTRIAASHQGLPVLLIHGYGCNSGYWHSLSKRLLDAGISHHAVDLEPVFGSIDDYAPAIAAAVEHLRRTAGSEQVVIVAHSMGGLAARAYLRAHGAPRIAKVITLGSPHRGTGLANFARGENSLQMRWNGETPSDWLKALEASETPAVRSLFVSLYSHHDNIISPQISSHLPGAVNIALHGIGHVALGSHPTVQDYVLAEIRSAAIRTPVALAA